MGLCSGTSVVLKKQQLATTTTKHKTPKGLFRAFFLLSFGDYSLSK